ncbi:MAG: Undecaprenyl-phosphate 4-deoxy-4-formamido-L-arabinose transferase [Candidatus Hydrogenedentes bacterium ADurb.Bin101]|jgi:glycosyltransferase involved in cell wall biosynthesis|nr:MAG: Undecaprenyl-phosphate 4-deoxy-4-formamido-L-arabinose transferase [Candidatus Hydrogenedentes bacterium ADurb.Bin101]
MITFVIPVFNESPTLPELAKGIRDNIGDHPYRILFIDDGSSDDSWETLRMLRDQSDVVDIVRLRRNFGKTSALAAGFALARGDIIITMDADLQDDPREIPALLAKLEEGYDVVCGWKQRRYDPWHKTFPSRIFNAWIARTFKLPLHDVNSGFKAMRGEVAMHLPLWSDMHRLIPVFASSMGYKVTEIAVQHHPRKHGKSKYGIERFMRGGMDAITATFLTRYGDAPGQYFGRMMLFFVSLVVLALVAVIVSGLAVPALYNDAPHGDQLAMTAIVLLFVLVSLVIISIGAVGLGLGLLGELLLRYAPPPDPKRRITETHMG